MEPDDREVCPGRASDIGQPSGARILGWVARTEVLGPFTWLTLAAPGWRKARPGQFALLQWEKSQALLARALSVAAQDGDEVSFLVAPVGLATRELCSLRQGERVWVLGPLGRGFDVAALVTEGTRTVVVAGGVGVAPFPLFLTCVGEERSSVLASSHIGSRWSWDGRGREVLVLLGFRDALQRAGAQPLMEAVAGLQRAGFRCRVEVVTEEGSAGPAGKVTDLLKGQVSPGDRLAVCGPWEMAVAVQHLCQDVRDVRVWYSLEANMACGVGSCHGCVIALADGSFARVCHEGPVFAGEEIFGG